MNISPTHLTYVETSKGNINVAARKNNDGTITMEFGYPKPLAGMMLNKNQHLEEEYTLFDTDIQIDRKQIEKVLKPLL
jgi:hypothetical protein